MTYIQQNMQGENRLNYSATDSFGLPAKKKVQEQSKKSDNSSESQTPTSQM
ncbi:MAG: hypothetical protein KDD45_15920 [Bdellovibrionales bacterium]|nr:hypothetical protein [Bdellovibrionales bacterium]